MNASGTRRSTELELGVGAPPGDRIEAAERARYIHSHLPTQGLFAGQTWRVSPKPFALPAGMAEEIETLGRVLLQFYRSVNLLYRQSFEGKQPGWIASWLDQGKPPALIELQRSMAFKTDVPRVIRPDLLVTEKGLIIVELDSVPGGIGTTAWLNQIYEASGLSVLGGKTGMIDGFAGIFGDAKRVHIVVSAEAATYRPEMEWICHQLNRSVSNDGQPPGNRFEVRSSNFTEFEAGDAVYRFFELFDLANIQNATLVFDQAQQEEIQVTPPPKPIFEEKLLFGLLWNRNLREFWHRELGAGFLRRLHHMVPYSWVVDPSPLPPHGGIPELNLTAWQQLKDLSQRERNLILKISGFSEKAWGARGLHLGSDLSSADWGAAVDSALASFAQSPYVLQRFHKPALVDAEWYDFARQVLVPMPGRVRLCPYYFVAGENDAARASLGGVLATICPGDKKIIHGMADAILAPCSA